MKKVFLLALVLLLSVSLFGCMDNEGNGAQVPGEDQSAETSQQTGETDEEAIAGLVGAFGSKLQTVSLLAPGDILKENIQESYGDFVSSTLLEEWLSDPQNAPGRLVSSPWPDRIEMLSLEKLSEAAYEVKGEIIEITSAEEASGGIAAKRPVTLVVEKIEDSMLITAVTLGAYEETGPLSYQNTHYGFNFSLPESWKGYTIVNSEWEGFAPGGSENDGAVETGPMISIRHPLWTSENKRQDIPIMVFTIDQWDSLQQEEFHIGAAPVGPKELGRNAQYVFALPARYNFAFPPGYEEVEEILESNPLQTNDNI